MCANEAVTGHSKIVAHILQIETGVLNPSKNSKQFDALGAQRV